MPPAQRAPRGSLGREQIVRAAMAIVEREGLSGLTMVALGRELGAHPTAVYRHFSAKDEVVRDIVHLVEAEIIAALPEPTDSWLEDLRVIAATASEVLLRYPSLAPITTVRFSGGEMELALGERVLANFERAGFSVEEAPQLLRAFVDALYGMVGGQAAFLVLPPEQREADEALWSGAARGLTAERYPHLAAALAHADPLAEAGGLNLAMELILEALAARAGQPPPPPR